MKRNKNDVLIAGVCSGLADSLGVKSGIVRLLFLLSFLFFGAGPIIYLVLLALMILSES